MYIEHLRDFRIGLRCLVTEYDKRIAEAETSLQKLRELRKTASLLLENEESQLTPTTKVPAGSGEGKIGAAEAAARLLQEIGNTPMRIEAITKALMERGWKSKAENPAFSVAGAIIRDGRFERVESNTYRLKNGLLASQPSDVDIQEEEKREEKMTS